MNKGKWKKVTSPSRLYVKLTEEFGEVAHEFSDACECLENGAKDVAIEKLDKMCEELDHLMFIASQLQLRTAQQAIRYGEELGNDGA